MAKYCIYAVAKGLDPNTHMPVHGKFSTWKDCEPYVKGVEAARYKGFLTEAEADAWLQQACAEKQQGVVAAVNIAGNAPSVDNVSVTKVDTVEDIISARSQFVEICKAYGIQPNDMVNKMICQFVAMHSFIHPQNTGGGKDDDILPFN